MTIRHLPTSKPYREIGETKIIAKDDAMADFLAGTFETFEQISDDKLVNQGDEFSSKFCEILERLICIERILRNGLPQNDKDIASTIAHAHAEIELVFEAIDTDGWQR